MTDAMTTAAVRALSLWLRDNPDVRREPATLGEWVEGFLYAHAVVARQAGSGDDESYRMPPGDKSALWQAGYRFAVTSFE